MSLLANFKNTVLEKFKSGVPDQTRQKLDFFTLFGILLYEVAAVSSGVSDEEIAVIKQVMQQQLKINGSDWEYTFAVIREVASQNINARRLTAEFNSSADYETRKELLDSLLKVASADGIVEKVELEKIKWISKYLWITPKDYNAIKENYRSLME